MNVFDTDGGREPGGPGGPSGAAPATRDTPRVNGTPVPRALLVPEAWVPSLFVRVTPVEVSWFAQAPVDEALEICRRATGVEPRVRHVIDRYFDTPGRDLFHRRVSVRLRHYAAPPREIAYEVVAVGWGAHGPGGRQVDGLVQTFERNTAADLPRILERYRAAGFEEVACFDKTRYTFEVAKARSTDARGMRLEAPERTGVEGARGWLKVLDHGIKLDVDDMRGSPFPEPSIIEVEYDQSRYLEAAPYADYIRAALPGRLREKKYNKIAYLLSGEM